MSETYEQRDDEEQAETGTETTTETPDTETPPSEPAPSEETETGQE